MNAGESMYLRCSLSEEQNSFVIISVHTTNEIRACLPAFGHKRIVKTQLKQAAFSRFQLALITIKAIYSFTAHCHVKTNNDDITIIWPSHTHALTETRCVNIPV